MSVPTFLSQWVKETGPAAQGPAKQHEFSVYVPPLMEMLARLGASSIVDLWADEGIVSAAFCAQTPQNMSTFVLPSAMDDPHGSFREMAEAITASFREAGQIRLVADIREIDPASADAILFNNILGCQGSLENIDLIVGMAADVVKPGGHAIVTVPNPDGMEFSSYSCSDLPPDRCHGGTYRFQMRGEDDSFVNLYLTKKGLSRIFDEHGFSLIADKDIHDRPWQAKVSEQPAFRQYVFEKRPG